MLLRTDYYINDPISYFVLAVNIILTFVIIFMERKQPSSTYAWLLFLWVFPVLGFLFYVLFSQKFSSHKIYKFKAKQLQENSRLAKQQAREIEHGLKKDSPLYPFRDYQDNIEFQNNLSGAVFTPDNDVEIITDGVALYEKMFEDFRQASSSINLEYYILKDDTIGQELLDLLIEKAEQGVQVRILFDEIGSRKLSRANKKALKEAGIAFGAFFPSKTKFISQYFTARVNYRDHRKIVVIDGKIGYIGGFNVGDEYLGRDKRFGYWRDNHIRLTGPAVHELQLRFIADWETNDEEIVGHPIKKELNLLLPPLEGCGSVGVQIVASGPDTVNQNIKEGYIKMIYDAKKAIYLTSPYFVLDESINEALKIALLSGVDVNILIPNKPDHPFIYSTTLSYAGALLQYGAKVYCYENGFVHAKTMCIDDELSVVGSCNFDIRSFALNYECSAFLYSKAVTRQLIEDFKTDITYSTPYTLEKYQKRGWIQIFKESISRLLAPLL